MSRSLMRHTIAELEQLFDALKTDPKTLKAWRKNCSTGICRVPLRF
ncbi:hypothetical protein SAMN05216386_2614 [Nitrosospira briensis]|uniref:Uncharacterized protein n=1 Tax=Nitrosospira briensis TaxID=35799 RepID=A0A1I5EDD1_9PROT|nr:hypothetical protein [Nitrosospira briensis]SFO09502.1 hypothetical protein SAMN05216386_2614 [Nitrosospira briensis]